MPIKKGGLTKRLVLDIGASAIRLCELAPTKSGYQLNRFIQKEVIVDPAADDEERRNRFSTALAELLRENKIRGKKAVTAVPGQSVFTRPRPLPQVPEHKVSQIVRYEIQQQIPFSLDQIAHDYQVLEREEGGGYYVLMAAIKVDIVERLLAPLLDAKKVPEVVDVAPLAAYNWLRTNGELGGEGETVALVDIGAATTDIVVERSGNFRWNRPLSVGGNDVTKAIAAEFNLSFEEAERLKRERGFAPTGDPEKDGKAGEVIERPLSRLVQEINRSFAYFRSQPGGGQVNRLVLTGGGAALRNLVPYLQRNLGMDVRIAQPLKGIAVGSGAQTANEQPERSTVALGLALRNFGSVPVEVNLIPPRIAVEQRRKEELVYWGASFLAFLGIMASIIPARSSHHEQVLDRIEETKSAIAQYDPSLARQLTPERGAAATSDYTSALNDYQGRVEEQAALVEELDDAFEGRIRWLDYLQAINQARLQVTEASPEARIFISNVESTFIGTETGGGPGGAGRGGGGRGGGMDAFGMGGMGGGADMPSTGFPGIEPSAGEGMGGMGGMGMGGMGGRGGGMGGFGGDEEERVDPPMEMNGLVIMGYASDDLVVTRFQEALKATGAFIEEGVYLDDANVMPAQPSDLANANTGGSVGGGAGGEMGRGGGMGGRGGGMGGGMGGMGGGARGGQRMGAQSQLVSFRIDVQFEGEPVDLEAPEQGDPGMGGPGMGDPMDMGF